MAIVLGKLTKVEDLRTVWKHEASDFTRWLAESENMALLSETIGLDITTVQVEDNVGDFNVDIYAIDETSGKRIIIENQLEKTMTILGKLSLMPQVRMLIILFG